MMTELQSEELCDALQSAYPNAKLTGGSPAMYRAMLGGVPFRAVLALLPKVVQANPDFCPSAPAFANAVQAVLNPTPTWEQGWEEVMRQVRSVGSWGTPVLKDPAAAEVVRALGWSTFCNAPDPKFGGDARELAFLQTRFREVYETTSTRQQNHAALDALPEGARPALDGGAT